MLICSRSDDYVVVIHAPRYRVRFFLFKIDEKALRGIHDLDVGVEDPVEDWHITLVATPLFNLDASEERKGVAQNLLGIVDMGRALDV